MNKQRFCGVHPWDDIERTKPSKERMLYVTDDFIYLKDNGHSMGTI